MGRGTPRPADGQGPPTLAPWLTLSGAVLVGVLTALQARVNGQLGMRLADGLAAAAISFGSGMIVLLVLSAVVPAGRRGIVTLVSGIRAGSIPWWMLLGGAAGALTVASQGLTVAVIGVSLFTVGVVAGQTLNGLVLDRLGYGPGGVVAVTIPRALGGVLVLVAVAVSLQGGVLGQVPGWMLILPFLTGVGIAWQQATNGRLRQRVGTPLTATLVNFVGGTAILVVVAAVHGAIAGLPAAYPAEWWLYTGGVIGAAYIFLAAAIVSHTGVLLLGLGAVAGQLVSALAMDAVWSVAVGAGWAMEVTTVSIALLSVVVAAVRWRRPRRQS